MIWDTIEELGGAHAAGPTMREVLETAGVDFNAVRRRFDALDAELCVLQDEEQGAQWKRAYDSDVPRDAALRRLNGSVR